ncbi:hypothetical protein [Schaalia odontolytica]|uniref:hypothetical protein n=1 Tax=Schaalia odontolytica TaxID=1660 RepID=UPI00065FE3FB|nr:hypothetical protein [Schaalia odontolytica]UUO94485.1 1-hydroxy-2-methyl-2-(E)-butenyl 4-diphosphate synthase [Schaalia odontolytica]
MNETRDGSERGDATVEFLGVVVVLVIPLLYVVLAVGAVSAGAMAVDSGAREAARILAEDRDREDDARRAVSLIVEDFGVNAPAEMLAECPGCGAEQGVVQVSVSVTVPLPFLPRWLGSIGVGVTSSARAPVREVVPGG